MRHFHQLHPEQVPLLRFKIEPDAGCEVCTTNIAEGEDQLIEARAWGDKNKRTAYKFMDGFHSLRLDKKDMMLVKIGTCEMLFRACRDDMDRKAVEKEITELKMARPDALFT